MKIIMSGHSSFYIRENWINKLFYKVFEQDVNKKIESSFFSKANLINAIDILGVGSKMVESIKFWADFLGILEKKAKSIELSESMKVVFELDPYLQNNNSLWILHSNIFLKEKEKALVWEKAFSLPEGATFTKESLEKSIELYYIENGSKFSSRMVLDTINVFIKTYYKDSKESVNPEENIVSPFVRLNYLKEINGEFKFQNMERKDISDYVIYYLLYKKSKKMGIVNQTTIKEAYEYVNKIVKMSYLNFEKTIQELEFQNELSVDRAAGLQNITIDTKRYSEKEVVKKILESELV
ncbi:MULTISPECIES: DUF4007 family protein [unclassified Cetobacterium]|uniref:DUF4007 family protein n=1 Tax=unclassified Cetobacterium TaxID=2630983 RepID=UPI0006467A38|nr:MULTISPECIES: DUF4007 family protein [unclassified Cetobacterium]